jgi:hypothetical protein
MLSLSLSLSVCVCVSVCLSVSTLSFLRRFLSPTAAMARKKITGDELSARAKANGYQRVHAETKAIFETRISMWTKSRWIKMQRWIVMSCKETLSSKTVNTDVGSQLAP